LPPSRHIVRPFTAARHAHGNRLTVGIVAMFAEEERRAISADMA
jgi:hypothetical protein